MADHGAPQYATADGNDYAEHVGTYKFFTKLTLVGTLSLVGVMISLALGGAHGHWGLASLGTIASVVVCAIGLASDDGKPKILFGLVIALLFLLIVTS